METRTKFKSLQIGRKQTFWFGLNNTRHSCTLCPIWSELDIRHHQCLQTNETKQTQTNCLSSHTVNIFVICPLDSLLGQIMVLLFWNHRKPEHWCRRKFVLMTWTMWNNNTRQQGSRCWHHHLFASLHVAAFCEPTCLLSHRGNGKQCWSYTLVCVYRLLVQQFKLWWKEKQKQNKTVN